MSKSTLALVAALTLIAAVPALSFAAVSGDAKGVSPSLCQPYAPNTTAAELQVTQTGIYNPGVTTEKVICPLPRDREEQYAATELSVGVYYRVLGGAFVAVTCTVFVGSSGMHSEAVLTATQTGESVNNGERSVVWVDVNGAQTTLLTVVPNALICTIPPKTLIAGIHVQETGATHTP